MGHSLRGSTVDSPPVLLCERDRDLRLALAGLLERAGHRVILAAEARAALSAAIAAAPVCIVLGLPPGGAEPEEVLRIIRGINSAQETPVVLIAPPDLPLDRPGGFRPNLDQRLPPTVRPDDLLKAVARAIKKADRRSSAASRPAPGA